MGASYRDEREAALARAEALERENAELRRELQRVHGQEQAPQDIQVFNEPRQNTGRTVGLWVGLIAIFTALYYVFDVGGR